MFLLAVPAAAVAAAVGSTRHRAWDRAVEHQLFEEKHGTPAVQLASPQYV